MKQLFLYLWFICMSTLTYAQQVTLSGKVEDAYTGNGLQVSDGYHPTCCRQ